MRELSDKEFEAVAWPLADYWHVKEGGSIFGKSKVMKRLAEIRKEIWGKARVISETGLEPYLLDGKEEAFDDMIASYCSCYQRAKYTADITFFQFGYTARQMEKLVAGIIVASHKLLID
jgi:hypothetical protein